MGNSQMAEQAAQSFADHLFDNWLRSEGFERKHTLDDATGLFRAISDQLLFTQIHHLAVRAECIDFMRKNRDLFEHDINQPYDDYLDKMSKITGWPGETEIQAMSLLYERDFIIYNGMTMTRINYTGNGFDEFFYLCQSSPRHYESIFPKESIPLAAYGELYPSVPLSQDTFKLNGVDEKVDKILHDRSINITHDESILESNIDASDELIESLTKVYDNKKDENGNSDEFSEALSQLSLQSNDSQRQNTYFNNLRRGDSSEQNNHTERMNTNNYANQKNSYTRKNDPQDTATNYHHNESQNYSVPGAGQSIHRSESSDSKMVHAQLPTAPPISSASASLPIGGQQAVTSTATPNYQNYSPSNGNYYPVSTIETSHQKTQDASNQQQPSLPSSYVCGGSKTINFPPPMSQMVNTQLPTAPQISSATASTASTGSSSTLPISGQQAVRSTAKTQDGDNQQQPPLLPQPSLPSSYVYGGSRTINFPPPLSQMVNTYLPTAPQISSASASTVSSSLSSSLPISGQQAVTSTATPNYQNYPPSNGYYYPFSTIVTQHEKTQDASSQQQPLLLPPLSLPGSYVCGSSKTMKFPSSHQSNINNSLKSGGNKSETDASNTLPAAHSTRDDKHADKVNNDRHNESNENIQPQQPQQQHQIKQSQIQQSFQQSQHRNRQKLEQLKRQLGFRQQQPSIPSSDVCGGSKTMNFLPPMSQMVNTQLPTAPQIPLATASTASTGSSSTLPISGQQAVRSTAKTQDGDNQQQPPLLPQPSLPSSSVYGGSRTINIPPPLSQMVNTYLPTAPQISSASASTVSSSASASLPIGGQQAVTSTATPNYQNYPTSNGNYYPVSTIVTSHQKTQDASNQQQPSLPSSYVCGGSKTINFPPPMSQMVNTQLPTAPQISSASASTVSSSSLPIGGQQAVRSTAKTQDGNNQEQPPLLPQPSLSGSYVYGGPKTINFPRPMSQIVNTQLPTAPQISSASASTVSSSSSSSSLPISGQQAVTSTATSNYQNYPPSNGYYQPLLLPQPSLPGSYVCGGSKTMKFLSSHQSNINNSSKSGGNKSETDASNTLPAAHSTRDDIHADKVNNDRHNQSNENIQPQQPQQQHQIKQSQIQQSFQQFQHHNRQKLEQLARQLEHKRQQLELQQQQLEHKRQQLEHKRQELALTHQAEREQLIYRHQQEQIWFQELIEEYSFPLVNRYREQYGINFMLPNIIPDFDTVRNYFATNDFNNIPPYILFIIEFGASIFRMSMDITGPVGNDIANDHVAIPQEIQQQQQVKPVVTESNTVPTTEPPVQPTMSVTIPPQHINSGNDNIIS